MKKIITGFVAASALTTPAFADQRINAAQGAWTFDFANEKICQAIGITEGVFTIGGARYETQVRVVNTDRTSENIYLPAGLAESNETIKALIAACDQANNHAKRGVHRKSYIITVTGTPAAGLLPAVFGGVVGGLPTSGTANAGAPGFVISVKVKD